MSEIQKTVVKRSRTYTNHKGSLVKSTIENYLRSDVTCHSQLCDTCCGSSGGGGGDAGSKLAGFNQNSSRVFTYLVPSYDVMRREGVFEMVDEFRENVVLTETLFYSISKKKEFYKFKDWCSRGVNVEKKREMQTLESYKEKKKGLGNVELLFHGGADDGGENYVVYFSNEHFAKTYVKKLKSESSKERNQRAYFQVGKYYSQHFRDNSSLVQVIVLTSTLGKEYLMKVGGDKREKNLHVMDLGDYVDFLKKRCYKGDQEKLKKIDKMVLKVQNEEKLKKEKEKTYPEYLSIKEIRDNPEEYVLGQLFVNKFRSNSSFLKILQPLQLEKIEKKYPGIKDCDKIEIGEKVNRNRAIHNDQVYVKFRNRKDWKDENVPEGSVVYIRKRNTRDYVVTLRLNKEEISTGEIKNSTYSICIPLDRRIPKFRIKTGQREKLRNYRFIVRFSHWDADSNYPRGFYLETIGTIGAIETETKSLLVEHELFRKPFSASCLNQLPSPDWVVPDIELKNRRDMRNIFTCSIDPIGCVDIDDAASYKVIDENTFEIGVHIADVSYFVKPGSELDKEAEKRSTSIYMVNKKVNMLPKRLSTSLCSLHMNQDRLCVGVVWTIDSKTLEIKNRWFGRTIINSNYAFHYDQVNDLLLNVTDRKRVIVNYKDGNCWKECLVPERGTKDFKEMMDILTSLQTWALTMKKRRIKRGGLELHSLDKVDFLLDKNQKPMKISFSGNCFVHDVVAELMITANIDVGKEIYRRFPKNSILRSHPLPKRKPLEELAKVAAIKGFKIDFDSNAVLGKSIQKAVDKSDKFFNVLMKNFAAKSMNQAVYKCSHVNDMKELYHYGLAADCYTHFTSPIRRYPDLLVHRILVDGIANPKKILYTEKELSRMCSHMNDTKKTAKLLQRESTKWYQSMFFLDLQSPIADGIIHKINKKMMKIFCPNYRINHVVYFTDRDGNLFVPIEERKTKFLNDDEKEKYDDDEKEETIPIDEFDIDFDEEKYETTISFKDNRRKPIKFRLFDHAVVKIRVRETRAHFPKLMLRLYSFNVLSKDDYVFKHIFSEKEVNDNYKKSAKETRRKKEEERKQLMEVSVKLYGEYVQKENVLESSISSVISKKVKQKEKKTIEKESSVFRNCMSVMFHLKKRKLENNIFIIKKILENSKNPKIKGMENEKELNELLAKYEDMLEKVCLTIEGNSKTTSKKESAIFP